MPSSNHSRLFILLVVPATSAAFAACGEESFDSTSDGGAGGAGIDGWSGSGGRRETGGRSGLGGEGTGGGTAAGGLPAYVEPPWSTIVTPTATGEDAPFTCEALDGPNCWKTTVDEAVACSPTGEGSLSPSGRTCLFEDGSRIDFSESVRGRTGYLYPEFSVLSPDGTECYSVKIDGVGDFSLRASDSTIAYDSLSVLTARVICNDGLSLSNSPDGTCDDYGARFLAGETPALGVSGTRDSSDEIIVEGAFGGTSDGRVVSFRCR